MNGDIAMTNALTTASGRPAAEVLRMTPGRRVLLAIGVPVALALIGWTGFGFVADIGQASFPVSDNIAVHDGRLAVSVNSGDLTVSGSSGTTARLTGKVQYDLIRPDFTESNTATGTRLGVACRIPVGNCGLAATLEVLLSTLISPSLPSAEPAIAVAALVVAVALYALILRAGRAATRVEHLSLVGIAAACSAAATVAVVLAARP